MFGLQLCSVEVLLWAGGGGVMGATCRAAHKDHIISVANWPNVRPHISKRAELQFVEVKGQI